MLAFLTLLSLWAASQALAQEGAGPNQPDLAPQRAHVVFGVEFQGAELIVGASDSAPMRGFGRSVAEISAAAALAATSVVPHGVAIMQRLFKLHRVLRAQLTRRY
jgi:hypothetical protein